VSLCVLLYKSNLKRLKEGRKCVDIARYPNKPFVATHCGRERDASQRGETTPTKEINVDVL